MTGAFSRLFNDEASFLDKLKEKVQNRFNRLKAKLEIAESDPMELLDDLSVRIGMGYVEVRVGFSDARLAFDVRGGLRNSSLIKGYVLDFDTEWFTTPNVGNQTRFWCGFGGTANLTFGGASITAGGEGLFVYGAENKAHEFWTTDSPVWPDYRPAAT